MKLAGKIRISEIFGPKNPKIWPKIAKNQFCAKTGGRSDFVVKCQNARRKILCGIEVQNITEYQLVSEILANFGLCYEAKASVASV